MAKRKTSRNYRRKSKKVKRKSRRKGRKVAGSPDMWASWPISKDQLKTDLESAIPYKQRFYLPRSRYDRFIEEFVEKEDDHFASSYAFYGKNQVIQKAKKELNKLDTKLKKRALVQKTFTRKLPPTAMTAISSMI